MSRQIGVYLGETGLRVGTLFFNAAGARESSAFEYTAEWLQHARRFPIDPALPLASGQAFRAKAREGSVFHGAIADTEPDGWARRVIQRDHAKRRRAAKGESDPILTSLDYLLAVDDFSRVGALRFQDEAGVFQRAVQKGRRAAPPLIELDRLLRASRAVEQNTETAADLQYLRGRGTSLGGDRPKCSVVDDDGALWIGKFPSIKDLYAVTKGEVLALRIAAAAGINAAEARLVDSDGVPGALIRRFDRDAGGRIPYMSAATLMGVEDSRSEHSYTELVDALRTHSADFRADSEELWRRVALTVLINNVDDHLHNHGVLHVEQDRWRLSPAFDLNPAPDKSPALKTWISEAAGDAASVEALVEAAPLFLIEPDRVRDILGEVEAAISRWPAIAKQIGMTRRDIEAFAPAFEHDRRAAARHVLRGSAVRGRLRPRASGRKSRP